ncbi:MAG TPA: hypothetical protein G4N98_08800 [Thermoflexia bacterium]|nr:hypothetical protein [Thermoflexia bacterium]
MTKKKITSILLVIMILAVWIMLFKRVPTISLAQLWSPLQPPLPDARTMNSPLQLPPTPTALPPAPTATPRITPTPPQLGLLERVVPYDVRVPLCSENITLADVQPFDAGVGITFKAWSPNGEQFLFGRTEQRHILVQFANGAAANGFWTDLWVADSSGSKPQLLANLANDWAWSPDGRYVAYLVPAKLEGVEGKLYVVDLQNLNSRELAHCDLGGIDDLAWLPTDEITCRQNGVMYAVDYEGSRTRQLNNVFTSDFITDPLTKETLPPVFQGHYHISLDGKKIGYIKIGSPSSLWIANSDGSKAIEINIDPYISYDWTWSPDSSRIAFSVPNRQGRLGTDLWMVNADGSDLRRVTVTENEDAICMNPTWSPDGKVIAYTYRANMTSQPEAVWVVNADGTNPHLLIDLALEPQWSANGNQIAVLRLSSLTDNPETFLIRVSLGQR